MNEMENFIKRLENTFNVKVEIKINYLTSREEMDKLLNRKSEEWLVGLAKYGEIHIFKKELFPKVSDHPEEDFEKILKHEISHLFINKAFGRVPAWFNEGLSCILAGQDRGAPGEDLDPTKLMDFNDFRKQSNPYGKSVELVKKLLRELK